jgi:hypothetical protein
MPPFFSNHLRYLVLPVMLLEAIDENRGEIRSAIALGHGA